MVEVVTEEAKMLGDALNTVKIQVQQMKRHLVCHPFAVILRGRPVVVTDRVAGARPAHGCAQECELDACRTADVIALPETVL